MVFLCKQFQHDLIPQAHSSAEDLALVSQIKEFRESMFGLLQQKMTETMAAHPAVENEEQLYRQIRHTLDSCPEIMTMHQLRGEWQDRLWAKVLEEIEADRLRLETAYASHQAGSGELALAANLDVPLHQRKADIHRMPGAITKTWTPIRLELACYTTTAPFCMDGAGLAPSMTSSGRR